MIVVGTKKLNLGGGIGCEIISGVVLVKKLLGMGNEGSRGGGESNSSFKGMGRFLTKYLKAEHL